MTTNCSLAQRDCVPCRGGTPPLQGNALQNLFNQLDGDWQLTDENRKIRKAFKFPDFVTALKFVNRIGELAESQGHHPDLALGWGRVEVILWSHKIGGLSDSDFVLAAKIDQLPSEA